MDNAKYLAVFLLIFPVSATATILDMQSQSPFFRDSSGNFINTKDHAATLESGKLRTSNKYSFGMPDGKKYGVTIPRDAGFDTSRLGKAVGVMAKAVPVALFALAAEELVCELADICLLDSVWTKFSGVDEIEGLRTAVGWTISGVSYPNSTLENALKSAHGDCGYNVSSGVNGFNCTDMVWNPSPSGGVMTFYIKSSSGTLLGAEQGANKHSPYTEPPPSQVAAVDTDWTAAETVLNDPDFVPHLLDAKQNIPVAAPDSFPPINTIIGTTTKQIKDNQGNITGTEVTERRMQITDASAGSEPNLVDVKEEKTVTTYDINNNPTGSTVETSEGAPPVEPPTLDETTIEFDNVADQDLEEFEFPDIFTYESWGEGTCPPDREVSYGFGTLNLAMTPACDFAQGIRPIILIIAGLAAMFIISGIRTE